MEKITNTSNLEQVMQFFLHLFCPIFQSLLHEKRKKGFSKNERNVVLDFILLTRFRSASLGDFWWHTWLRREKTIQARVKRVARLFEEWCKIEGADGESERARVAIADEITEAIVRLGKTYRNNIHLIRHDLDLKHLEGDIKYYEALRSLGVTALTDAVSSAFGEIFKSMRRESTVIDRAEEIDFEEGSQRRQHRISKRRVG